MSQTERRMIRLTVSGILNKHNVLIFGVDLAGEIADAIIAAKDERNDKQRQSKGKNSTPHNIPPEVMTYHDIAGHWPHKENYNEVVAGIQGKPLEVLREARRAWLANGKNPCSIIWLKWANHGGAKSVVVT